MNRNNLLDTYSKYIPQMKELGAQINTNKNRRFLYNKCRIQTLGIPDDFMVYLDGHVVCEYAFGCIVQPNKYLFKRVFGGD